MSASIHNATDYFNEEQQFMFQDSFLPSHERISQNNSPTLPSQNGPAANIANAMSPLPALPSTSFLDERSAYDRKAFQLTSMISPGLTPQINSAMSSPMYASSAGSPAIRRKRGEHMAGYAYGPYFRQTKQIVNIFSLDRTRVFGITIRPKIDRGFFLADNHWTCYRRNYFQVSSGFACQDESGHEVVTPCLIEVDGQIKTVTKFLVGVSGLIKESERVVELIQHTPKRDKGPVMTPSPKPCKPGGNPLPINAIVNTQNLVTFERLQFKSATANNGKRRAAQQFYILNVEIWAQCDNGERYIVAFAESAPLVVRGRSPGHYSDNRSQAGSPYSMEYPRHTPTGDIALDYAMLTPQSPAIPHPSPPTSFQSSPSTSPNLPPPSQSPILYSQKMPAPGDLLHPTPSASPNQPHEFQYQVEFNDNPYAAFSFHNQQQNQQSQQNSMVYWQ